MNLLGLLLAALTAKNSLAQIAKKTGLSEKKIKKLMMIAVPVLLKYLTQNASSVGRRREFPSRSAGTAQ